MAFSQKPPPDMMGPASGMKKTCIKLYDRCPKWINVQGQNPQTGEAVNQWDCADAWVPILLIENSGQQRGTQAAVESLRNETARHADQLSNVILPAPEKVKQIN